MATELSIGTFSRITHLSVKTLRHYHDCGLLAPATVDPDSGYRYYSTAQVPTAQTIRRFRDLEMPIEGVKAVLAAPDPDTRQQLIAAHLRRMEEQLSRTQEAVVSLRELVEGRRGAPVIEHLTLAPLDALAIAETVARAELAGWWRAAFAELDAALSRARVAAAGAPAGTFANEVFENEIGECMVYIPTDGPAPASGRAKPVQLAARELAVAIHEGPHTDVDLVYAALGTHVTELGIDGGGPVHERYLVSELDEPATKSWRTEIGWPIASPASP